FVVFKNKRSLLMEFVLVLLTGILLTTGGVIGSASDFISSHLFLFMYTFFGRSFEFFTGIVVAVVVLRNKNFKPVKGVTYLGVLGTTLIILLISTFQSENFRYGVFSTEGLLIHNLILPLFIAILFLGLIYEKTAVSFTLSSSLFILLGQASY